MTSGSNRRPHAAPRPLDRCADLTWFRATAQCRGCYSETSRPTPPTATEPCSCSSARSLSRCCSCKIQSLLPATHTSQQNIRNFTLCSPVLGSLAITFAPTAHRTLKHHEHPITHGAHHGTCINHTQVATLHSITSRDGCPRLLHLPISQRRLRRLPQRTLTTGTPNILQLAIQQPDTPSTALQSVIQKYKRKIPR